MSITICLLPYFSLLSPLSSLSLPSSFLPRNMNAKMSEYQLHLTRAQQEEHKNDAHNVERITKYHEERRAQLFKKNQERKSRLNLLSTMADELEQISSEQNEKVRIKFSEEKRAEHAITLTYK